MGIVFFPFPCMRLYDWRKECYVRFRRLYEENLADIYSSANSVGDLCPNSEDSDSISPDPASILSSATETIVIAFSFDLAQTHWSSSYFVLPTTRLKRSVH